MKVKRAVDIVVTLGRNRSSGVRAWVVVVSQPNTNNVSVVTGTSEKTHSETVLAAMQMVVERFGQENVHLYSADQTVREAGNILAERGLNVTVYGAFYAQQHPHYDVGTQTLTELLAAEERAPTRLNIGADGSWSRHNHTGGIGVICDDGRWSSRALRKARTPLDTELAAIAKAVKMSAQHPHVTIFSDSLTAVNLLQGIRPIPASVSTAVGNIHADVAGRDVVFCWVKGHAGHVLNDGADRLAVAGRRHGEADINTETHETVCENIVQETLRNTHLTV